MFLKKYNKVYMFDDKILNIQNQINKKLVRPQTPNRMNFKINFTGAKKGNINQKLKRY